MSSYKAITPLLPAAFISGTLLLCAIALHGTGGFMATAEADPHIVSGDGEE